MLQLIAKAKWFRLSPLLVRELPNSTPYAYKSSLLEHYIGIHSYIKQLISGGSIYDYEREAELTFGTFLNDILPDSKRFFTGLVSTMSGD